MAERKLKIQQSYFVAAPVSKVFRALSDPRGLTTWFLAKAQVEPRKGGAYEFEWRAGYRHSGKVLDFVRGKKLSLTWPNGVGRKRLTTRVTFSVRRQGRGTRVHLRHTGYPRSDPWIEVYGATQCGWSYFLMNLKSVLEHGHDLRSPKDG